MSEVFTFSHVLAVSEGDERGFRQVKPPAPTGGPQAQQASRGLLTLRR